MRSSLSRAFNASDFVSVCLWGFSATRTKKPAWCLGFHQFVSVCLYFLKLGKMNEYKNANRWNEKGKIAFTLCRTADFRRTQTQTIKNPCAARTFSVSVALAGHRHTRTWPTNPTPRQILRWHCRRVIDVTAEPVTATED
jgi:hypothetical protein